MSRGLVDEAQHPQEQHASILELLRTPKAGVGFGRGSDNRLTEEAWSRLMLKDAILSLRMYDPEAYLAINEIFNTHRGLLRRHLAPLRPDVGGMITSNAAAGTQPDEVLRSVVAIDCTVLLPLLFFGGLRLWRGEAWGYVLGGLLLTKLAATGFTLAFTTALGTLWAGRIGGFDAFLFVVFALMVSGAILLIAIYG